ncbi:WD40 repeat domain-containing protein [Sporobolomyces salmoneus]|uniref:WD40 repeat domain-containing protein n=1 Tax=Sporobolomyces salmoneus TaxID=183962 RepID=UPI00317C7F04
MLSLSRPIDYSIPPTPFYILRGHSHPLTALYFSQTDPSLLFSGDSNGVVAIWDLRTFRVKRVWKPHLEGILSLSQLGPSTLITHGRDNKIHLFRMEELLKRTGERGSFEKPLEGIESICSLDVNAMNFCRLSLLDLSGKGKEKEEQGLIAVPSLTKDDQVDIWHVPSKKRLHRSVGISQLIIGGNQGTKTGSVMAVHLLYLPTSCFVSPSSPLNAGDDLSSSPTAHDSISSNSSRRKITLHLLIGYESGQLALLEFTPTSSFHVPSSSSSSSSSSRPSSSTSNTSPSTTEEAETEGIAFPKEGKMIEENEGWGLVWVEKCHRDAVMSIEVSQDGKFVYTVGIDHLLVKYRLWDLNEEEANLPRSFVETTNSPGKSTIRSRIVTTKKNTSSSSGGQSKEILAVGGWNGEVTIYSNRTLEPLASLSHHRNSVQTLDFAPLSFPSPPSDSSASITELDEESDSEDEEEEDGGEGRRGILATGGMDLKICLWKIYPPRF